MKPRERPGPATVAVPPPELRLFTDPSRPGGRGTGLDAYADRGAWLAARREWAAGPGMTVVEWFGVMLGELRAERCTLDQTNQAFSQFLVEDDDWEDPRLMPA